MGLLDFMKKKPARPGLAEDIPKAEQWFVNNMHASGYPLDGTVESFRRLDLFFDSQSRPGGVLADGHPGSNLFAAGCYMGQVFVRQLGGVWETDDADPQGEVHVTVRLPDGSRVFPVEKAIKRLRNGEEDGLYVYGKFVAGQLKEVGDS